MGNINVNRSTTDTDDNFKPVRTRQKSTPKLDAGLMGLIIVITISYIILWVASLGIAGIYCWDKYECLAFDVTYIGGGVLLLLGIFTAITMSALYAYEQTRNVAYLDNKGVMLSRESIDRLSTELVKVAMTSARSEATAGIDTWSPSVSTSSNHTPLVAAPVDEDELLELDIVKGRLPDYNPFLQRAVDLRDVAGGRLELVPGYDKDGRPNSIIRLQNMPSITLSGRTRQGKSTTAEWILTQYALDSGKIILCDGAGDHEQALWRRIANLKDAFYAKPARSQEDIVENIRLFYEIAKNRAEGKTTDRTPLMLVIDEYTQFINGLEKKEKEEIVKIIKNLTNKYGKYNIFILVIAHNLNGDNFGSAATLRSFSTHIFHNLHEVEVRTATQNEDFVNAVKHLKAGEVIVYNNEMDEITYLSVPQIGNTDKAYANTFLKNLQARKYVAVEETDEYVKDLFEQFGE